MKKELLLVLLLVMFVMPLNAVADEMNFNYTIPGETTITTNEFDTLNGDNITISVHIVGEVCIYIYNDNPIPHDIAAWTYLTTGTYLLNHTFLASGSYYIRFYNTLTIVTEIGGSFYINEEANTITIITITTPTITTTRTTNQPDYFIRILWFTFSLDLILGIAFGVTITLFCMYCRRRGNEDFSYLQAIHDDELYPPGTGRDE